MITEQTLHEIEKRLNDSQPGPWIAYIEGRDHESGDSFIKTEAKNFMFMAQLMPILISLQIHTKIFYN